MNIKKSLSTYFPGILLFLAALIISIVTYRDYGMAWDEQDHRTIGIVNYDHVVHNDRQLPSFSMKEYGAGFEMPLIFIERKMRIKDTRDIYLMRHFVTHLFFLVSMFFGYVLIYRLFKNQFLACLGFFMLAFAPRIYAHSFFNTTDIPVLCLFVISFTLFQAAFEDKKMLLFLLLGMACGYTTGIRVIGIVLGVFVFLFLLLDIIMALVNKEKIIKPLINTLLFIVGFGCMLYLSWPYLWSSPFHNFMNAYNKMAHYVWESKVLLMGKYEMSYKLPDSYFPVWFLITNPIVWLLSSFAGIVWIVVDIARKPLNFLKNTNDRNFLLYLFCFAAPIIAVLYLHAVIYDDWRHLYFVYPSFILLALYFINKIFQTKYKLTIQVACIVQVTYLSFILVKDHPFQQVYFNMLVSHNKEHLRKNYDYDYWGASYIQALNHLVQTKPYGQIKLCLMDGLAHPLVNNILMLQESDRKRIEMVDCNHADYFITNFRWHPADYPNPVEYTEVVQNSTVICIYRLVR